MANPRTTNGPKEGKPGAEIIVPLTDVIPPQLFVAEVQADGYFSDEFYAEIDDIRREYRRGALRGDD